MNPSSPLPLEDRAGLPQGLRREIADATRDHATLHQVLQWGRRCQPPRTVSNVVVQDEYTHDVVVPWSDGLFVVYDST